MKFIQQLSLFAFAVLLISCAGHSTRNVKIPEDDNSSLLLKHTLPLDSQVLKGQLENGLTYYIRKNNKPENRVELRLVVNAGSTLEDDDQQGLAHFCEHMAFNGTEHFAKHELVDYLESIGMRFGPEINAYTSFDETVYMLQVPTDSQEVLSKAFLVLRDWAHAVSFDNEEIDKERGVVIEEWRLGRGAQARMRDKQLPILFKDSRYAQRLPIGQKAVLDTFHYETLKHFYRDWYRPELMAVIAVGNFDPEEIKDQIETNFRDLPIKEKPRERTYYPVKEHEETLFAIASDPEAQFSGVSIYHKLPSQEENTVSDYKRGLIEQLYNRMFRQRLDELNQQADPPFLFATSAKGQFVRTGEIYMLNSAVKDNGIPTGFETLLREAERVEQFGFTESELERQKTRMLVSMERMYNERDKTESDAYADEYARNYLLGEPIPGIETEFDLFQKLIPQITLAEVNALAKEWNAPSNRVVMVNSPEKEGVTIPDEDQLRTVMKEVNAEPKEPYRDEVITEKLIDPLPKPAPVMEENYIPDIGVTEWKLYNGVRIILKPTDFKNDQVLIQAYSPGGYSLALDSDLTAAKTADAIINQGGLGQFNQIQLSKLLADKNVSVSPYIDELYEGFSGRAVPKDLETMFQLIYLYFTKPRTDSTAYLALLDRFEGIFQNRDTSPESAYQDTITATLTQHNSRYKPWSLDMLEGMNLQKSSRFYRNRFADAGDFVFIIVGNFELPRVRELAETYLASLPGGNRVENWRDVSYNYPSGVIEKALYRGQEPKSLNSIDFTGPFEWTLNNRYQAEAMLDVLRIKLHERIREDMGGTYGVRIRGDYDRYPRPQYKISISFGANPERVEELTHEIFTQIDSLRNFGTTETNLQKVKEMHRREYETNLKENGYWLGALRLRYQNNLDPADIIRGDEKIDQLNLSDIQEAARKYLNPENYVRVVLYPEDWPQK